MTGGLTADYIGRMLRAAGSSTSGKVTSLGKIADLFNDAILRYGDGKFTSTDRVAALVSECLMESAYFTTTTEFTAGRNSYSPYDGRSFIQVTHKTNYAAFGAWCRAKGLVSDKNVFVDNPKKLSDLTWAALGGVWYFTHTLYQGKAMVEYSSDIRLIGRIVNNGPGGVSHPARDETVRIAAFNAVKALGSSIVPEPPPGQVKDEIGTTDVTTSTRITVDPTANAVHTAFGQWGPSWSWNRGKNKAHPSWGQHGGDDWHRGAGTAEIGDPIYAVAAGRVIFAGSSNSLGWGPAFGNHVLITWADAQPGDGGKHRTSVDAHMSRTVARYGQQVKAGDLIGYKGMTGNVSGPHDHHEQHLGQGWGDKRVKPVYPGYTITKTVEVEQEITDMKPLPEKLRKKSQTVKPTKNNVPATLLLEDSGDVTWAFGPGRYYVEMFIRFREAVAADELMVRPFYVDTDKKTGKATGRGSYDYNTGLQGSGGTTFGKLSFMRDISKPASGRTRRNRISVENYSGHDIVVTEVITRVWES